MEPNARVTQRVELTPGLIILRVAPIGNELAEFHPGQFAVLGLSGARPRCSMCDKEDSPADPERLIKRAYSIASSSRQKEFLEFYVSLVPSGALTPRLFALRQRDDVWVSPRFSGVFTLSDLPRDAHVILISTGTGLAPYLSMLRDELECGAQRKFAVMHGARHSWELGYRSELTMLESMCPNFSYIPLVSRPEQEPVPWHGEGGYVQDVWARKPVSKRWGFDPDPTNSRIFLCGNPGMVQTMIATLANEGFAENTHKQPGQVHAEKYW